MESGSKGGDGDQRSEVGNQMTEDGVQTAEDFKSVCKVSKEQEWRKLNSSDRIDSICKIKETKRSPLDTKIA